MESETASTLQVKSSVKYQLIIAAPPSLISLTSFRTRHHQLINKDTYFPQMLLLIMLSGCFALQCDDDNHYQIGNFCCEKCPPGKTF